MTCGRLYVYDTLLEGLAQNLQDVAAALRQFTQQEHPMVRQRHFAWHRHLAPTDQADIGDRGMRGATWARRDARRAVTGAAGDAMNARGVDGLGQGHVGQDGGEPACQHRLARSGWPQEQDVMGRTPASDSTLHRYLVRMTAMVAGWGIVNLLSGLFSACLVCHIHQMHTPSSNRYKHHRFPAEIISHGVWLYYRFCLSYRDVEELLFALGIVVTYEAIRKWCVKFGQAYTNQLRRRRPQPGDKRHLDEVFLSINGQRSYLWRGVDQDGNVLDILVQRQRDKAAAKRFFRKLLKGLRYVPRVIITDQLKSYGAAKREFLPGVEHRQHRYLNNRAENSHQLTRQRERRMQGFKSPGHAQRFLAAYGPIVQYFRPRHHLLPAPVYR